jgi:hypothetical protein
MTEFFMFGKAVLSMTQSEFVHCGRTVSFMRVRELITSNQFNSSLKHIYTCFLIMF